MMAAAGRGIAERTASGGQSMSDKKEAARA